MYTLLTGFYKYLTQKDEYCVVILGLDNAGKTTYLEAAKTQFTKNYKGMNPAKITTTVGLNIGTIDVQDIRLNFWDLGGQQELQSLWDKYYQESHGVIYVIDSSDCERMDESKQIFGIDHDRHKMTKSELLSGVPMLILANKKDLPESTNEQIETILNVFDQYGRRDCLSMPVSALTGEGVDEGIKWLAEAIKKHSNERPPREND